MWSGGGNPSSSNSIDNKRRKTNGVDYACPPRLDCAASASASASDSAYSSSSSQSLPWGEYEVFLNFRGPDTRYQITDILYRFLVNLKIRTFKDDDELRKGEGIWPGLVVAIEQSKIYVPIFSENYAYSKWCLRELAAIVERQERTQGCIILPIFYMVDPRDVRHQTGPFQNAFEEHEKNFDEETVRGWRDALKKVGEMKGWHAKSSNEQGAIADLVTGIVCSHLSKNNNVLETDKLIGIDDHIEAVNERMALDSPCVTIVGIYGMGGIGKTTIAKAVYNKVFPQFTGCSFAEDVREMLQQKDGAIILQKHIISGILGVKKFAEYIANSSEGIRILQDRLSGIKFLIVLDDVDEKFQFNNILGDIKKFVPGSRFIITSRNIKVLRTLTDDCKLYRVQEMSDDDSLQLFCNHAFKQDSPPSSHETLSKDIVSIAAGLPLALKVIGSDLFQEEVVIWEDKLRLLQEIPEEDVVQRLRISYDSLNYEAKQIFLDIACFFIGDDKDVPFYMWSDCGFFPTTNINILIQRSLIEIEYGYHPSKEDPNFDFLDVPFYLKSEFRMHDQLKDMGREIVRLNSIKDQTMECRIWSEKKFLDMLLHKKGTKRVKGIRLHHNSLDSIGEILQECFVNLSELRYLNIEGRMSIGDFSNYLPNLRWLRLSIGREDHVPKFSVKNLVILELSYTGKDKWRAFRDIKMATKLKVLKLFHYELSEFPEFPRSLEILYLVNGFFHCLDPKDLDIGNLGNLKVLRLNYSRVREIKGMRPSENIEGLHLFPSFLTTIFINDCTNLEWLPSLEKLENLNSLSIEGCLLLKEIVGLGGLKALEILRIKGLPSMVSLSELFHLDISYCHSLTEIQGLEGLESLQILYIDGAKSLTRLLGFDTLLFLNKLESFKTYGCPLLTLPRFHDLDDGRLSEASARDKWGALKHIKMASKLKVLDLWGYELYEFPEFPGSLEMLYLRNSYHFFDPKDLDIGNLGNLKLLHLVNCRVREIKGMRSSENINGLHLFPSSLTTISIDYCSDLEWLPSLEKLENLTELCIEACPRVKQIVGLGGLKALETLRIIGLDDLGNVDGLDSLYSLKSLSIERCDGLTGLPSMASLSKLLHLDISDCHSLTEIQGLEGLESLQTLSIRDAKSLSRLFDFETLLFLNKLEVIKIHRCPLLTSQGFHNLDDGRLPEAPVVDSLQKLRIIETTPLVVEFFCRMIQLFMFPSLEKLTLYAAEIGYNAATELRLDGLESMEKLVKLNLIGLESLRRLPPLAKLGRLTKLSVNYTPYLRQIEGLAGLKSLEKLDLTGCTALERLPAHQLSGLEQLERLDITDCTNLIDLPALRELESNVHILWP